MGQQNNSIQSECRAHLDIQPSVVSDKLPDDVKESEATKQNSKNQHSPLLLRNTQKLSSTGPSSLGNCEINGQGDDVSADICKKPTFSFGVSVKPESYEEDEEKPGFISVMQLYNSLNDGQLSPYKYDQNFMLIIDTRPFEDFESQRIITSHHVTVLEAGDKTIQPLEVYEMIVLYGSEGSSHSNVQGNLAGTVEMLREKNQNVFVLEGGYRAFHKKHPYLCSSREVTSETMRQNLTGNYASAILDDQLYLGSADQACSLQAIRDLQITHILNVTVESPPLPLHGSLKYMHIRVMDNCEADLLDKLTEAITFIDEALNQGGHLLVHCMLGVSRSATIVIAYLMYTRHWTLLEAQTFVRKRRPIIQPNRNFTEQLLQFEEQLFGQSMSKLPEWHSSESD